MISKDDFIKERLNNLIKAAEDFLNSHDVTELSKSLNEYNLASTDYDDLKVKEKIHNQQIEDRNKSTLPLDILAEADNLFLKLKTSTFDVNDTEKWEFLFNKIFDLCKKNIELSKEKETINWIARSLGFIANNEAQFEFIRFFWPICEKEVSSYTESYASLINFLIFRMNDENRFKLKNICVLDKNNKYTPSLAEAYRTLNSKPI